MKSKAQILKDNGIDIRTLDQNYLIKISKAMDEYAYELHAELDQTKAKLAEAEKKVRELEEQSEYLKMR